MAKSCAALICSRAVSSGSSAGHGRGQDGLPRGPVPHPGRLRHGPRHRPAPRPCRPAGAVPRPARGPRRAKASRSARLGPRRVRRPGHHVRRCSPRGRGSCRRRACSRFMPSDTTSRAGVDGHALAGVDVAGVGQLGALLEVRRRARRTGRTTPPARSAARRPRRGPSPVPGQALEPERVPVGQPPPARVDPRVQPGPDQVTGPGRVAVPRA